VQIHQKIYTMFLLVFSTAESLLELSNITIKISLHLNAHLDPITAQFSSLVLGPSTRLLLKLEEF